MHGDLDGVGVETVMAIEMLELVTTNESDRIIPYVEIHEQNALYLHASTLM